MTAPLTITQVEILLGLSQHKTYAVIASELGLSVSAVRNFAEIARDKLKAFSVRDAVEKFDKYDKTMKEEAA